MKHNAKISGVAAVCHVCFSAWLTVFINGVCFMAFNLSPKVAEARDLAKKYGKTRVIIFMIDDDKGTMEYASYGKDKALCSDARKLADVAYKAIYDHLLR